MTSQHTFLGPLLPITLMLMLTGCLGITDGRIPEPLLSNKVLYKQSQNDWQNAATRENDLFSQHKLQIFAAVAWKKRSDAETYQLIKLSMGTMVEPGEQYLLDLLSPQFNQKMACGWYCEYLDQPIMQAVLGPYTMLDKTYESQKQDLLNFYRSLNQLNQHLNALDPSLQAIMPVIFAELTETKRSFDSLAHVTTFLNDYFDDIDFDSLLAQHGGLTKQNPTSSLAQIGSDLSILPSLQPLLDPEAKLLASFRPDLTLADMLQPTPEPEQRKNVVENTADSATISPSSNNNTFLDYAAEKNDNDRQGSKQTQSEQPKAARLNLQQFVCSYKGNYFGIVNAIKNDTVSLELNGQAMQIQDGLLAVAQDGILFSSGSEFSYLSLEGDKEFKQEQLKACHLSGF
jgi:hypothetical protein